MKIKDLRILDRLAAVLNITTVANEFQMAPGTVSKKTKELEVELGIKLFDRSTRSMRLTEEGRIFLDRSQDIIAAAEAALSAVDDCRGQVRGGLKITAPKSIGPINLDACFACFCARYPQVEMHVDLSSRYVNLQDEGYDLAIRTGALSDSTHLARRLGDDPQVIAAAPSYLAQFGTPRRPQDLEHHSCLVLGDQWHWEFKGKSAVHKVRVSGRMRGNDASLLLRCAVEGSGIIRTSRALAAGALSDGSLKELLSGYDMSSDAAIWAVYPNSKYIPPRLRTFIDFLSDWLKQHKSSDGFGGSGQPDGPDSDGIDDGEPGSGARAA